MRLYSSAVDKFEKVLAIKADNVPVLVNCGLALKDMALCMSLDDPDTLINLEVITHEPCTVHVTFGSVGDSRVVSTCCAVHINV